MGPGDNGVRRSAAVGLLTGLLIGPGALSACSEKEPDDPSRSPSPTPSAAALHCPRPSDPPPLPEQGDVVEDVGGLVRPSYTVRYAKSSPLGVVALVEGDVEEAEHELVEEYGVALVAPWDPDAVGVGIDRSGEVHEIVERCQAR